jgi:siroheme synthase (precorrin-2 oxidase/ferrochelatase)
MLATSNYLVNYNNLINKPSIADAQVNSDWNSTSGKSQILNKPDLTVIATNNTNLSNYVLSASNYLVNYNNLINKPDLTVIATNNTNLSNYVLSASNNLVNYTRTTSNNIVNYIVSTSNYLVNYSNLINKPDLTVIATNNTNLSNYVLSTSNYLVNYSNLINKPDLTVIATNNTNLSNYILATSNNLIFNANLIDANTTAKITLLCNTILAIGTVNDNSISNYVLSASNYLVNYNNLINKPDLTGISTNNTSLSNYVLSASNNLSQRITNLNTDMITENVSAVKKFIVNNSYNNNLEVNGTLTINSNLIVLGDTTRLDTIVYTTERLEVVNANNTTTAFMVQQNTATRDIFVASNMSTAVFRIANNGDVLINGAGVYKKNDRDVILDTSNYVLSTCNYLIDYNNLINKPSIADAQVNSDWNSTSGKSQILNKPDLTVIATNNTNVSNYVLSTSNNLVNYTLSASNYLINYMLATSNYLVNYNNLINKPSIADAQVNSDWNSTSGKSQILNKPDLTVIATNNTNASNYVLSASNYLVNYNNLINKPDLTVIATNNTNLSNYVLATSNNLIFNANLIDTNTTAKITLLCNTLLAVGTVNDGNVSNYVLSASNLISQRITDLSTDTITENISAAKKFIVNNRYNNNLEVNGTLTVNSNLIVLGDTTRLDTIVYNTERLEVVNANNTTTAFMVQQNTATRDIFVASNISTAVFRIANNGDVLINGAGVYKRNDRDVVLDTSNYIATVNSTLTTSIGTKQNTINSTATQLIIGNGNGLTTTSAGLTFATDTLTATNIAGAGANITALNMGNALTGTLAVARGGTGSTSLSAGQVLIGNTTNILQTTNLTWSIANSRLGIGTATPETSLHVVGEIVATNNITSYYSDERLKTKISGISEPLKIINNLNGFYYIPNELAYVNGITNKDKEIGLSAQEVQKVLPEIVKIAPFDLETDKDGNKKSKSGENYLTMSYERLAPVFVEAIKELETKNRVQEQKILELERKNQELTDKYNKILEDIIIIKKTVWRL